ncbi:MAG: glycine--tRNA ligase subunit beta [Candidatus Cloacimonetes bacterium]|nr:glycine--tRNA ligase subunit beta [Candidatus Cloacimonadota bacterium]
MQVKDFLLEFGIEEIPAGYIAGAVKTLNDFFRKRLNEEKLQFRKIKSYSTPRRITVKIEALQARQQDEVIERIGPAKNIAYDENGDLTKAASGFLRSANAAEEDIYFKQSAKGEKIAIKLEIEGKETKSILNCMIKEMITRFDFPKTMKWGNKNLEFARPIRWLVSLFGDEIIEFEIEGIKSGNISFGNRFQKLENIVSLKSADEYERILETVFVIADREKRKKIISDQLSELFSNSNEAIIPDPKLLEIVTDLVEFPTAVIADFDQKYLVLPEQIIILTLSQHQKYFAVKDNSGKIVNKFVFVSNGDPEQSELIKLGNEKVIKARLEDAAFFFKEDTRKSLSEFVSKLKDVTFQAELGSLLDKTKRIEEIVEFLTFELDLNEMEKQNSLRAALLCKADLVTLMLGEKEFTKLQGYIGKKYAELSNEPETVCDAIFEHYLPRGQNDELPKSITGSLVAIADKIDTICGIIGVDLIPSGSNDPFALRRAGNGIVQIIDEKKFEIDIHKLIDKTFEILIDKLPEPENNKSKVTEFFKQRVSWLLKNSQIDYDVIESVMHIDHSNIYDLKRRASDLHKFKQHDDFIKLVIGFKRVSNIILKGEIQDNVDESLLLDESEKMLFDQYLLLSESVKNYLLKKNYEKVMVRLVEFGKYINKFFDDVLVNTDDRKLKQNRYNLLGKIRKLFLRVADLNKIVVEG